MDIAQLDVAIRITAATALLLLAWLQLRGWRRIGVPAALFAPLAVCLSAFVIQNTPKVGLRLNGIAGDIAHFLSGFAVIFLWWFCLSCFDNRFRPKGGVLGVGLAWAVIAAIDRGLFGPLVAGRGLSLLLIALGFGIVAHLVWRLLVERPGDLIQQRHDARIMVAILLGGMLLIDLTADLVFGFAWRPLAFAIAQNVMALGFALWLAGRSLAVRPDVLTFGFAPSPVPVNRTQAGAASARETALHHRLTTLMETQRIFLDPDLTFAGFVAQMGATERRIRQLINHDLGHDHFRTFLNHYRVAEARRLLGDRRRAGDKLITIGLDSGFGSLASFNRAFRSIEGCSPGDYRARASQADPGDADAPGFGTVTAF